MAQTIAKFVCFTSQPRFQHDCTCCKFLGILETSPTGDMYDMYTCTAGGEKSYILRYGHRDSENRSLPADVTFMIPREGDPYKLVEKLDKLGKPSALYRVGC